MRYENTRSRVLAEAMDLITGDREKDYGTPQDNFQRIAVRWSQFLGIEIEPWQVCVMMADLKIARMCEGYKRDSVVDLAGYAALTAECAED